MTVVRNRVTAAIMKLVSFCQRPNVPLMMERVVVTAASCDRRVLLVEKRRRNATCQNIATEKVFTVHEMTLSELVFLVPAATESVTESTVNKLIINANNYLDQSQSQAQHVWRTSTCKVTDSGDAIAKETPVVPRLVFIFYIFNTLL